MKKFKCTVTRTDEYIIEFDEDVINEEWMSDFREYMCDYDTLEEHAENIAQFRARFGGEFIEGYGMPLINGKLPLSAQLSEQYMKKVNNAINIKILSEDKDCEVEVEEI